MPNCKPALREFAVPLPEGRGGFELPSSVSLAPELRLGSSVLEALSSKVEVGSSSLGSSDALKNSSLSFEFGMMSRCGSRTKDKLV